ncbi:tetratricopeptide repeat protein [Sphingomonas sp. CJ20]
MKQATLDTLLRQAQSARDAAQWDDAARLFRQAEALAPAAGEIKHNLAMIAFARGDLATARPLAEAATALSPRLWQAPALLARVHQALGDPVRAEAALQAVLAIDPANGTARLGLANLAMNAFGDAEGARALVAPLLGDPAHGVDAELTSLMAALYLDADGAALSARLTAFSQAHLRLPRRAARTPRAGRRRIGLVSPLFTNSPVYHLTFPAFATLAAYHDLHCFARGTKQDEGTAAFRGIATAWHDVAHLPPDQLAERIAAAEIDILFDLGGWADVAGLKALSAKPAARMYKWVGGQSATTGIDAFDGWIGDAWQSPDTLQPLYAEPLVAIAGGYCDYDPPAAVTALHGTRKRGVALVGNPAKIAAAAMLAWPEGVDRVALIDRRYAHARTRERVEALLAGRGVAVERVEAPVGHHAYLRELARCEAIVNTQPYAAGLTAVEAMAMGVRVLAGPTLSPVFAARHQLSHARTSGRNPALAAQLRAIVEA